MRIEVRIECPTWATDRPDPTGLVEVALAEAGEVIDDTGLRGREVCVVLGDDAFSRRLNDTWRGRDGTTNVLAFPTMAPGAWREIPAEVEESLGDIVLARIGEEITLKRLQRIDAEHVELQPVSTNPEHKPIEVGPTTVDAGSVAVVVEAIVGT